MGQQAGTGTTGQGNCAMGWFGGSSLSTGENNVIIGRQSQASAGSGNNQIVMGYPAIPLKNFIKNWKK